MASLLACAVQAAGPTTPAYGVTLPAGCVLSGTKTVCTYDTDPGQEKHFRVPGGVRYLELTVDGGSGGRGSRTSELGGAAGVARQVAGRLEVRPGDILRYVIGGAGGNAPNGTQQSGGGTAGDGLAGYRGGAGGMAECFGVCYGGGGGGAATVVSLNADVSRPIIVAGGGGGGGGQDGSQNTGGAGGWNDSGADGQHGEHEDSVGDNFAGRGGAAGGGSPAGEKGVSIFGAAGGGGGGGGYPNPGSGGEAGNGLYAGSAGGGGAGDSWDGGGANWPSGLYLKAATMNESERDAGSHGSLILTYTSPIVDVYTEASPRATSWGDTITYSAQVESYSTVTVPTGIVSFLTHGKLLCTARLTAVPGSAYQSEATCTTRFTPVGIDHIIETRYSGDGSFPATKMATATLSIVAALPTRTEMVSAKRINQAKAEFTAQVLPEQAQLFSVTGSVTFFADNDYTGLTSVCQARVSSSNGGRATCSGHDLNAHTVYAVFSSATTGWAESRSTTVSIPL